MMESKYRQKHYEEITFRLYDEECPYCNNVFSVDLGKCKHILTIDFEDVALVYCPYCRKRIYVHD